MARDTTLPATKVINVNQWLEQAKFNRFHAGVLSLGIGVYTSDGYDLVIYGAAVPLLMKAFHAGPADGRRCWLRPDRCGHRRTGVRFRGG